jgi:hypothetical protein
MSLQSPSGKASRGAALLLLALAGCATPPPLPPPLSRTPLATVASGAAQPRWYSTCFRFGATADGQPDWALDLLLADRVAGPALAEHAAGITLWRFHRRAAPDAAGHMFTVLAYASRATADALRLRFDSDPVLARLRATGALREVVHDCRATEAAASIEATSDPAWAPSVQRSWPWFIMGVSASWLAIVREIAREIPPDERDPLPGYRAIDARIDALWAGAAQHAYLHHLSGVYGYKPLKVETWMRF